MKTKLRLLVVTAAVLAGVTQSMWGAVSLPVTPSAVSNKTSTTVANAVVVLLEPPRPGHDGPGKPLAGVVANNAGAYAIRMPPGTYRTMVFGSNSVFSFSAQPLATLAAGQTVATNLSL